MPSTPSALINLAVSAAPRCGDDERVDLLRQGGQCVNVAIETSSRSRDYDIAYIHVKCFGTLSDGQTDTSKADNTKSLTKAG